MKRAPSIGAWLGEAAGRAQIEAGILVGGRWTEDGVVGEEWVSWAQLSELADRAAAGFAALDLDPREPVGVVMSSSVATLAVWFGLARAGLIELPLNTATGPTLLEHLLDHAGVSYVVCDADAESAVRAAAGPGLRHLIVHEPQTSDVATDTPSEPAEPPAHRSSAATPARHRLADLLSTAPTALPSVDPTSTAVVLYTSGTTGPPKGALLSHRANVNLARHTVQLMGYTRADRLYSVFPLFHSNARYCSVMAAADAGASVVLDRGFSASRFWDRCRAQSITAFNYQGAMLSILAKRPRRPDDADHSVRAAFGTPCPPELFTDVEARFGIELTEIYGSTEVSIVTDMPPTDRRIGSAGRASANYTVAVVDDHDEPVPAGATGEIVARPKHAGWMFDGYHRDPAATAASWRSLWFHTGDRGRLDADGFLHFVDRMKDTIRRRGENVSSWEIERVLTEHRAVGQVAAYGLPSEVGEEDVAIAVVPAQGAQIDPADLIEHCRAALTAFALPRFVRVLPELPQTPSQRVEKYRLRADGVTADTWDREAAR